tara:strand:- start:604 stop:918 length:315 start_codon:yes stop_codon:yes gene_type:complete
MILIEELMEKVQKKAGEAFRNSSPNVVLQRVEVIALIEVVKMAAGDIQHCLMYRGAMYHLVKEAGGFLEIDVENVAEMNGELMWRVTDEGGVEFKVAEDHPTEQ